LPYVDEKSIEPVCTSRVLGTYGSTKDDSDDDDDDCGGGDNYSQTEDLLPVTAGDILEM
jgi:hypothetical protein